jgi:hypothetical protein
LLSPDLQRLPERNLRFAARGSRVQREIVMRSLVFGAIAVMACSAIAVAAAQSSQDGPGASAKPALRSTRVAQTTEQRLAQCQSRCTGAYNACVDATRRISNPEQLDAAIRGCSTTNNYCQTACEAK